MNVSSTEKGRAIVAAAEQRRREQAKMMREHLANHFGEDAFTYHQAMSYVRTKVTVSGGGFQNFWTGLKDFRVLVSKDCPPGQWRFDPDEYQKRYSVPLVVAPVVQPPPAKESLPPLPQRHETAAELERHLPGLLAGLPPQLVVLTLCDLLGRDLPTRGQVTRLRRLLKERTKGLSDEEKGKLFSELLADTVSRFQP